MQAGGFVMRVYSEAAALAVDLGQDFSPEVIVKEGQNSSEKQVPDVKKALATAH